MHTTAMEVGGSVDARESISFTRTVIPSTWIARLLPVLLAIHATLLAYGAAVHSPTYNEPAHLVAGISYWRLGRFDLYSVNPPLVRMIAAAPVVIAGCATNWDSLREGPGARPEMQLGAAFCKANGERTVWLVTLARWACIPFSLLGGYICFRWARELYGAGAGCLALTLWCFCPSIIAHGQLITCDAAATALGVTACYTFWRWLKTPTWQNTIFSALVLGLAELTKTTLLLFFPLWPLLWLLYRWPDRIRITTRDWLRELGMLGSHFLIGLYLINLGYGFEGSLTRLGDYRFVSIAFSGIRDAKVADYGGNRFSDTWLGDCPVPLPKNYLLGIDLQRKDFESYGNEFYLGGTWSRSGWWYYYVYALAIKVPLGTWLLLIVSSGIGFWAGSPARLRDELFLLAPAIIILALVSSQTGMNEHLRYVLPIFPFVFIWLGRLVSYRPQPGAASLPSLMPRVTGWLVAIGITWSVISSLRACPHHLSYFNEIVGGSANGWAHLTSSNIDWGQDLLFLKQWSDENPRFRPLRMALYGTIDPQLIGIDGDAFWPYVHESELPPGYYAVSATIRAGFGQPDHPKKLQEEIDRAGIHETVGGSIIIFTKD